MAIALDFNDVMQALRAELAAPVTGPSDGVRFGQVAIDSRQVEPGALFVALPGEHTDGHIFLKDAAHRGARAAIISRPTIDSAGLPQLILFQVRDSLRALQELARYWRSRFAAPAIGITGSVGKTTTKELIALVLGQRFAILKNQANFNNEIGLPLTLLDLDPSVERIVVEMGMYDLGEIARLCEIARPRIGVVTNVGPVHLQRLGSLERIMAAKSELIESLPQDGLAILNGDDRRVRDMADRCKGQIITVGFGDDCDLRCHEAEARGWDGLKLRLSYRGTRRDLYLSLIGRHLVPNALAAAAVGLAEGLTWDDIEAGLQRSGQSFRAAIRTGIAGCRIIDDSYNASPASVLGALDLLAELPGRRIAVLGDMRELGSYERTGHEEVGQRAAATTDLLITVGELGAIIGEAACRCRARDVRAVAGNSQAIAILRAEISANDVVLVKGSRAMQMEEIVQGIGEAPWPIHS